MKLYETTLTREECIREYNGYTEIGRQRYAPRDFSFGFWIHNNAIIFGYEFDNHGAGTGLKTQDIDVLFHNHVKPISKLPTYGAYVSQQGIVVEENGYMLIFDEKVSPVSLGAMAHKIAELFRQESVLAIYNGEVSFVYA